MHQEYESMYEEMKSKMKKTINVLEHEFSAVRAGRANAAVLDLIRIDYYGTATPINQLASISVPEARTLIIQPWDASILTQIEKGIQTSGIGINPNNDGKVIRLSFPPLTEERRKELVKSISKDAEGCRVAIRNIRRDAIDMFKGLKKKSEVTEDDLKNIEKDIQELTDKFVKEADHMLTAKEKELMEL